MAAQRHVAHMVRYNLNDDNEDDNNIYRCAFHYMGIERPSDFLGLPIEDMQGIDVYQTDECTRMNFNITHRRRITRLTDFWHSLPVESRSWTAVSYDEFEAYLSTQPAERGGIDYALLIAAAIPQPPTATEIATAVVGAVPDTAVVAAAVAGALPGAPLPWIPSRKDLNDPSLTIKYFKRLANGRLGVRQQSLLDMIMKSLKSSTPPISQMMMQQ